MVMTACRGSLSAGVVLVVVTGVGGPASVIGFDLSPMAAGILALMCNTAAYISEILRAAYSTISRGQVSAGRSLGMRSVTIWRQIILPQVFHRSLPPLTNSPCSIAACRSISDSSAVYSE